MNWTELDRYLIGEAWTSADAYPNLEALCDIGSRFAGSPGGRAARDFILDRFKAYGLANARTEPFDFLVWTRGECSLKISAPVERVMRSAISLVYSPNAAHLRGEVVDCGIGSEADFARGTGVAHWDDAVARQLLAGKIAMVTTANPEQGRIIHRREKYGRAVSAGAIGFIYVNHTPGMLAETGSLRPGRLAEIAAVGLSYEDGWEIARQCKRGRVEAELHIQNRAEPGQGYHVVGEIIGQSDETVVAGAHYDGHDISQGAIDDGTGAVVVLELARILGSLSGRLRRTVRLIAFDAEELGVLGSTLYVDAQARANALGRVALMLNLDGASGPVSSHGFLTHGFADTDAVLRQLAQSFGYRLALRDRVVTATDSFPFFMQGIPALHFTARTENPALGRGFGHTAADTLDKVSEVDIKAAVMTVSRMLARLADHAGLLGARKSRDEIKQVLIDQDLERPLRAQDKWPF
ncbi:MAG: M28 family peptidase [Chloroflexi bacterium]|nr:M28 family peptidase [Chloroflexota bacterium]